MLMLRKHFRWEKSVLMIIIKYFASVFWNIFCSCFGIFAKSNLSILFVFVGFIFKNCLSSLLWGGPAGYSPSWISASATNCKEYLLPSRKISFSKLFKKYTLFLVLCLSQQMKEYTNQQFHYSMWCSHSVDWFNPFENLMDFKKKSLK